MNAEDSQLFFPFPARRTFFDGRLPRQLRFVWPSPHCRLAVRREQAALFDDSDLDSHREEFSAR